MSILSNNPGGKLSIFLIQQGVWEMPLESMPLASGYLKATALRDERIRAQAEIVIQNFRGGMTIAQMANQMFTGGTPDVLAFSVLGWNFRSFGELATTFKQLNPDGWVVFGGTHVAQQAARVFRIFPDIDIVVNGEGEFTFRDLLNARLDGMEKSDLHAIPGISFRDGDGQIVTNPERDRIEDLEVIPSPYLSGAIELTDATGAFRYDVALMETNRGCPYKCAFCYWGGAVAQKVRAFSMDRLRAELELFAKLKVHSVVLCDANFGLLPGDVEFVAALIETRDRYGFPRALETSWAKNKSKRFFEIVKMMKDAGMRSSFTLALQTLSDSALESMNRRNMKLNEWEDLAAWLDSEGLDCYAELIWGAPGETIESFMDGYDRLSRRVSRIAVYPILLLPNTDYWEKKELFGIKSVRGDTDDFEYVLAHNTMTFEDNQRMRGFLFWARVLAENLVLRHTWVGLRGLAGMTQSQVLGNFDAWICAVDDLAAAALREFAAMPFGGSGLGAAITFMYTDPDAQRLLNRWWTESIRPLLSPDVLPALDEVFRYDLLTQPISRPADLALPVTVVHGEEYYVRRDVQLTNDIPTLIAAIRADANPDLTPIPRTVDLYYRTGSEAAVTSTNHETIMHFMGMTSDEVLRHAHGHPTPGEAEAA